MYYGFFGLVFAFYTYYYAYAGGWDYYMTGSWTHEPGQLDTLLAPGFYVGHVAIPVPKFIAAPLYFFVCIAVSFGLFVLIENLWAYFAVWRGKVLSKTRLRHSILSVCSFLTFNLFYVFAGRPNILLMPGWAIKLIDATFVTISVSWLIRSLARDADIYRREHLARTLRDQLARMEFQGPEVFEGRSLDGLSADEIYVLAKTLPNFSVAQKRQAYRAVLTEALEAGHTKSAESLGMLSDLRAHLGLSEADHAAITQALGIQDPALLDPAAARSVELRVRLENYRRFIGDLVQEGLAAAIRPSVYLASSRALAAARPVRILFGISDEDHERIVAEATGDGTRFSDFAQKGLAALFDLEVARFSLIHDPRSEALLLRHALLLRQRQLIPELVNLVASVSEHHTARELGQSLYSLVGKEGDAALTEAIKGWPDDTKDAFRQSTLDPLIYSYLDVVEAAKPSDQVFGELAKDGDPIVAAIAVSALASRGQVPPADLLAGISPRSAFVDEVLSGAENGMRADAVVIMAELLAVDIFDEIDMATLASVARRSAFMSFSAGEQICTVGDNSDSVFVLVRGETEAWIEGDARRIVLGRGKTGTVFGELGVITGRPRSASIEVVSPTATAVAIPRNVIDELLGHDLHVARGVLKVVSGYLLDTLSRTAAHRTTALSNQSAVVH